MDESFNPGSGFNLFYIPVLALVVQPDGKILVGGAFTSFNGLNRSGILRLNTNGSLDPTFDTGAGIGGGYSSPGVSALAVQTDRKVIIGGNFTTIHGAARTNLARLAPDGSVDTSFTATSLGEFSFVTSLALQADGKLLVRSPVGNFRYNLTRLNTDGSLDATFDSIFSSTTNSFSVSAVAPLSDGRVVVGGNFSITNSQGEVWTAIARLNCDGELDRTFVPMPKLVGTVNAVAVSADETTVTISGNLIDTLTHKSVTLARLSLVARPALLPGSLMANDSFQFLVSGELNRLYRIEATVDFGEWTPIGMITNHTTATVFTDFSTTGVKRRFYRAVLIP